MVGESKPTSYGGLDTARGKFRKADPAVPTPTPSDRDLLLYREQGVALSRPFVVHGALLYLFFSVVGPAHGCVWLV